MENTKEIEKLTNDFDMLDAHQSLSELKSENSEIEDHVIDAEIERLSHEELLKSRTIEE